MRMSLKTKMLKSFQMALLVTSCLGASGCIGAFVAGAAAGTAVMADRRAPEVMVNDQNIVYAANQAIKSDPVLRKTTHVEFSCFNRVLLVTGQVKDEATREEVISRVRKVEKVRRVYNELTVGPLNTLEDRSRDAWITAKVKAELAATKGMHSTQVKVVTENGSVYLMGLLTPKQAEIAVGVTRKVYGVKRVVKLFEIEA
jgi:osmotically-inducible protein OsmY